MIFGIIIGLCLGGMAFHPPFRRGARGLWKLFADATFRNTPSA